jgi:hypothetical protein
VGSGSLAGKVGDGGSHPGGTTPVRAEKGDGVVAFNGCGGAPGGSHGSEDSYKTGGGRGGEARFNLSSKPRGAERTEEGENQ